MFNFVICMSNLTFSIRFQIFNVRFRLKVAQNFNVFHVYGILIACGSVINFFAWIYDRSCSQKLDLFFFLFWLLRWNRMVVSYFHLVIYTQHTKFVFCWLFVCKRKRTILGLFFDFVLWSGPTWFHTIRPSGPPFSLAELYIRLCHYLNEPFSIEHKLWSQPTLSDCKTI